MPFLAPDLSVVFHPAAARRRPGSDDWLLSVRGWVFARREGSLRRRLGILLLRRALRLRRDEDESDIFVRRARAILVDPVGGVQVSLTVGGEVVRLDPAGKDGHFREVVLVPGSLLSDLVVESGQHPLRVEIACVERPASVAGGWLLEDDGVSVISDIDDTIKRTDVQDKSELLRNIFLREHEAIPGMVDLYQRWAEAGAAFHYVSNSPWQLFGDLSTFLSGTGFPEGDFHLRPFRWRAYLTTELLGCAATHKRDSLRAIIAAFPQRRFVLVGDAGERDPEVYGALAREFPGSVALVLVREFQGAELGAARAADCFRGVPRESWLTFRDPAEIDFDVRAI